MYKYFSMHLVEAVRYLGQRFPALRRLAKTRIGSAIWNNLRRHESRVVAYAEYRQQRLQERQAIYRVPQVPGLFSFVTTVWDTDPVFLRVLADSVFSQRGGTAFEWLILDNGSQRQDVIDCLKSIGGHPCVRLSRVEANLGIIGGMRWCLENAGGRYILPLDADDYLYPDCAVILTEAVLKNNYPPLLYTDEDKLYGETYRDAYFKPDWDPILFANSCYIAHFCAIDRQLAVELGAYTDKRAEGSHDWHTFTLFFNAGYTPVHVPEVVYSWRMHPQSTSSTIGSKPYVYESQKTVLNRFIAGYPRADLYWLDKSPLFDGSPDWWIRRHKTNAPPLTSVVLRTAERQEYTRPDFHDYPVAERLELPVDSPVGALHVAAQSAAARGGFLHLLWDQVTLEGSEWPWEILTLMELFPDTVMVGGRILGDDDRILCAGSVFGFGRGCDCPDVGRPRGDPGFFAQMWKSRSVSAVSAQHAGVDGRFLLDVLDRLDGYPVSFPFLGAWLGAMARRQNARVAYTPLLTGVATGDWDSLVPEEERSAFVSAFSDLMPENILMSPHLGLTPDSAYLPVSKRLRERHLQSLRKGPVQGKL